MKAQAAPAFGRLFTLAMLIALMALGCTKKSGTTQVDAELGPEDGRGSFSDQDLDTSEAKQRERWNGGNIPRAEQGGLFQDVLFDYDSSAIGGSMRETVRANAEKLMANPETRVEVEGHCDRRGTAEYNMALGQERAKAVANLLISYGAKSSQVSTISYGAEVPVDNSDSESAYAKNRRAHLSIVQGATSSR